MLKQRQRLPNNGRGRHRASSVETYAGAAPIQTSD